jgi:hypothetical protein
LTDRDAGKSSTNGCAGKTLTNRDGDAGKTLTNRGKGMTFIATDVENKDVVSNEVD